MEETDLGRVMEALQSYKYTMVRFDPAHQETALWLKSMGFTFLDRYLCMEIPIQKTKASRQLLSGGPSLGVTLTDDYGKDMEELAIEVYTTDRRFHLGERYDRGVAGEMIHAYLAVFQEERCPVVKLLDSYGSLLGFTILRKRSDVLWENVMGVTMQGIKGKLAAYCLYNGMLDTILTLSSEPRKARYMGMVSSENTASLNLHIGLGAIVSRSVEEYIFRSEAK